MKDWIRMIKDEEEKLVHPKNVKNHENAGWTVAGKVLEEPKNPEVVAPVKGSAARAIDMPDGGLRPHRRNPVAAAPVLQVETKPEDVPAPAETAEESADEEVG
jgi:hypothetical protein